MKRPEWLEVGSEVWLMGKTTALIRLSLTMVRDWSVEGSNFIGGEQPPRSEVNYSSVRNIVDTRYSP